MVLECTSRDVFGQCLLCLYKVHKREYCSCDDNNFYRAIVNITSKVSFPQNGILVVYVADTSDILTADGFGSVSKVILHFTLQEKLPCHRPSFCSLHALPQEPELLLWTTV